MKKIFGHGDTIHLANTQRQENGSDSGVYAIAAATTLGFHGDPSKLYKIPASCNETSPCEVL